jgi:formate dehydrogenase major subunit
MPSGQEGKGLLPHLHPSQVERDETMQHPRCVLQIVKRHFARYTPEMVEQICGIPHALFFEIANTLAQNSGRERTSSVVYAVGWTQHTVGVQMIRAAAILQTLLGNAGRPGGGVLALRGHANIQGSTDIATLYDLLPGYLLVPHTKRREFDLATYLKHTNQDTGWWHNYPKYFISLLKAWYGDAATQENDYAFDYLPKISGDYSEMPFFARMKDGNVKGYFLMGENPAVGSPNARLHREALARLDWLVVRDLYEIESASFWKQEGVDPATIGTEVFFMPAASHVEKDGSFTNTQRLIQFREKAVEPPDDARSDTWFLVELGERVKALYQGSEKQRDKPVLDLVWNYPREGAIREPVVDAIVKEINGYTVGDGKVVKDFEDLRDDGSTASGCWIFSGIMPEEGKNLSKSRQADEYVSLNWGFAWPANRRILYNRASADPDGKPWSERKRYVWWDAEYDNGDGKRGRWVGYDVPDFPLTKAPNTPAQPLGKGMDAHSGSQPFTMQTDGCAWLYVPRGITDGPLPTHYEPIDSPVPNLLYPHQATNPAVRYWARPDNRRQGNANPDYPYAITTYRVTEHHVGGAMSRWLPWLSELQPALFAEISSQLAAEHQVKNGDWVTIWTARGEIEARALVSERIPPLRINNRLVHQIGLPFQWGYKGVVQGDIVNDLTLLVADRNVSMHEAKSFAGNMRRGRRTHT